MTFTTASYQPLADRMRPTVLEDFIGQAEIFGENKPLFEAMRHKIPHSMILWGPPGTGKTTLAKLIAKTMDLPFESLSAVLSGVKEIRAALDRAIAAKQTQKSTVLLVDEVHRFNKAQQDIFLPYIEDGTIIFVGATTENPSFSLNNALLSRARVYVLKNLDNAELLQIIERALSHPEGLGKFLVELSSRAKQAIVSAADGDARRALNLVEQLTDILKHHPEKQQDDAEILKNIIQKDFSRFDKQGDIFYDQISALHKAVRGSSPDAALYWLSRMLVGGCDPHYIARRVVRMASEDIGNADPRALTLALDAWNAYERLGSPEGELMLAQAVVFCACAAKSNAVYMAFGSAKQDAKSLASYEVPLHMRNAPTALMKELNFGAEYRYAHDEVSGFAAGESYFPEPLKNKQYYFPKDAGLELKIKEKLAFLRRLDAESVKKRYDK